MKYKSELLSELIEKNGHTTTKVPHYESECENEFISEVRGAYPKLIDYSGEWLNYANEHMNIGKFPIERVTDVTNARFENVVPYDYKSAILKGSTKHHDIDTGEFLETFEEGRNLELVSVKMPVLKVTGKNLYSGKNDFIKVNKGKEYNFYSNVTENATRLRFELFDKDKNLINDENSFVMRRVGLYGDVVLKGTTGAWVFGSDKKQVALKGTINAEYIKIREDSSEYDNLMIYESTEQIAPATYESFKSNILTANEEVELRGIGGVQDTLDCLTGEVVERIGEIVLDGSQTLQPHSIVQGDTLMIKISAPSISFKQNSNLQESWDFSDMICDKELIAETTKWNANEWNEGYNIALISSASSNIYNINSFVLAIRKSYFNVQSIDEFKTWLTQNPLTIQYKLAKESIKTVDLSCLDENNNPTKFKPYEGVMYVQTSSETLPPLLDMEVPVEAINQNIASFI